MPKLKINDVDIEIEVPNENLVVLNLKKPKTQENTLINLSNYNEALKEVKYLLDKTNILNFILPPLISISSIFLISTTFIYFYDNNDNRSLINNKDKLISINSISKLL